jgi:hypothetical protein
VWYRVPLIELLRSSLINIYQDAERYRWLRQQTWDKSDMFVIVGSKSKVRLGTDCPSHERLDKYIDCKLVKKNENATI